MLVHFEDRKMLRLHAFGNLVCVVTCFIAFSTKKMALRLYNFDAVAITLDGPLLSVWPLDSSIRDARIWCLLQTLLSFLNAWVIVDTKLSYSGERL